MSSTNVFKEMCVKITLLRSTTIILTGICNAVLLPVMHRSDAYSSTNYSRGIRWLPSPEVCRMSQSGKNTIGKNVIGKNVRGIDWVCLKGEIPRFSSFLSTFPID